MNHNWEKTTLGELQKKGLANIQTGPFGTVLKASEYSDHGVPVISVGEIRSGFLQLSKNTPLVSEDTTKRLPQFLLEEKDIVFGRKGAIDRNSIINDQQVGWFLGSDGIRLRLNNGINSTFISYLFRSNAIGKWLLQNSSGSIMPSLNQKILDRMPVWLPEMKTQKKIASILTTIDSKIEINNKINAELESMAKLIYDYWFVQFDFPDENGKPYKSSGGKMVWNEELKKEIPKGWRVDELGNHYNLQRGISYKGSEINGEGIPMINLNSFNLDGTYKAVGIKIFSGRYTKKHIAKPGDLLLASTDVTRNADIIGKAIIVPEYYSEELVYSMDIANITPYETLTKFFLLMLFNSKHYHNYIKWFASGTLVLHLNTDGISWYKMELPPRNLLKDFDNFYKPIRKKINANYVENKELQKLRDWLLPMLMNGQVLVK